ncbi:hypothetical protein [Streptomyces sp. CCM_MD2014]|uniref:hypothetical protein n=1 Tax=Streptomyces sp. CCM_MD2014 TaxID=1561022 RepID=UPI00052ABEF1|nr:hypothetical protein [Streptomyces sp. CCM_MD2014]AIV36418.1 hypothetical protein NI25_25515 [Streptomyces sp. CCM_MD2014]
MADSTSEKLMAQMRGEVSTGQAPEVSEPPVDPRSQEIMDAMRGGSERDIRRERAEHNLRNFRAQEAFEARVTKRAKEIAAREDDRFSWQRDGYMELPLDRARAQIQKEDREAREAESRRKVDEQMREYTRRENETLRTEAILKRDAQARAERKKRAEGWTARQVAALMAELNKPGA